MHGAPCRFTDPARFSLAHGGKDRHPFPVPTKVYDHTIDVLKSARRATQSSGNEEQLDAIKRLDEQARRLERTRPGPSVDALIAEERARLASSTAGAACSAGSRRRKWRSNRVAGKVVRCGRWRDTRDLAVRRSGFSRELLVDSQVAKTRG